MDYALTEIHETSEGYVITLQWSSANLSTKLFISNGYLRQVLNLSKLNAAYVAIGIKAGIVKFFSSDNPFGDPLIPKVSDDFIASLKKESSIEGIKVVLPYKKLRRKIRV